MLRSQAGFTFIELMLVIMLFGILATVSIPRYSQYIERSRLTEMLFLSQEAMKKVVDYYAYHGRFPDNNEMAGLASPNTLQGRYVGSITIETGAIQVKLRQPLNNYEEYNTSSFLSLRPAIVQKSAETPSLFWVCGYASPPENTEVFGTNKTDIPNKLLTSNCQKN